MVSVASVDFGTTSSVVAYIEAAGPAVLLQHGTTTRVPSAVFWDRGHLLAGAAAVNAAARAPDSFEPTPKRQISAGESVLPFDVPVPVHEAVAAVLGALTAPLSDRPHVHWVATHPVAWASDALAVLANGFTKAGIEVGSWVPEPVAAAWRVIPFERRRVGARYAVFDWGGGTFDAAILTWDGSRFSVDAHDGDERLGGEDIDDALLAHVLDRLPDDIQGRLRSPSEPTDLLACQLLRRDVQDVKHRLSSVTSAPLTVVDRVAGEQRLVVSRGDLDALAAPFVQRCLAVLSRCLLKADVDATELAGVFLTGDASRLTLAASMLRAALPGVELELPVDAKGVVALGAADFVAAGPQRQHPSAATEQGRPVELGLIERPQLVSRLDEVTEMLAAQGADRWEASSSVCVSAADAGPSLHVTWHTPDRALFVDGEPVELAMRDESTDPSGMPVAGAGSPVARSGAIVGADDDDRVRAAFYGDNVCALVEVRGGSPSERRRLLDANLHSGAGTWTDAVSRGAGVRCQPTDGIVWTTAQVRWGFERRVRGESQFEPLAAVRVTVGGTSPTDGESEVLAEVAAMFAVSPDDWTVVEETEWSLFGVPALVRGFEQRNKLVVVVSAVLTGGAPCQAWVCLVDGSAGSTSSLQACEALLRTVVRVSPEGVTPANQGVGIRDERIDRRIPTREELTKHYTKDGLAALARELGVPVPPRATKAQMLDAFDASRGGSPTVLRYEPPDLSAVPPAWAAGVRRSAAVMAERETVASLVTDVLVEKVGGRAPFRTSGPPLRLQFQASTGPMVTHLVTILSAGEWTFVVWDAGVPTASWLERRRFNALSTRQVLSDQVAELVDWLVRNAPVTGPAVTPPPPPPGSPPPPGPVTPSPPLRSPVKEHITLRSRDGQANVIASVEPVDPTLGTAAFADAKGASLRGLPDYSEQAYGPSVLFGDRDGMLRRFSWSGPHGRHTTHLQAYHARDGSGYRVTATARTEQFAAREGELRRVIADLRLRDGRPFLPEHLRGPWSG